GPVSVWWVQLSTAIISGLSFATLLTLVVTPVLLAAPTVIRESSWNIRESAQSLLRRRSLRDRSVGGATE
ncbi:MAG: hypothetical protein ACFB0Z_05405, partial [Candidatus Phaeomarinobacter sp.]